MSSALVHHVISGDAYFSGLMLVVAALLLAGRAARRARYVPPVLGAVGVLLVGVSSTGPSWLIAAWIGLLLVVLAAEVTGTHSRRRHARWAGIAVSVILLGARVPALFVLACPPAGATMYVIGDSISAGSPPDSDSSWPTAYAQMTGAPVVNLAKPGATLATALEQRSHIPGEATFVLLEIGGNDLLGKGSVADYRRNLETLLRAVRTPGRQVYLCELPLPPFCNAWGAAQRELATRYGVTLIPRRRFAAVLTAKGATVDGLHLSADGSRRMAATFRATFANCGDDEAKRR